MTRGLEGLRALLVDIRATPGLIAFCSIINTKLADGESLEAHLMLVELGATPEAAHDVTEFWPRKVRRRLGGHVLSRAVPPLSMSIVEEAAVRLTEYVPGWADHDWPSLLHRAVHAAHERAQEQRAIQARRSGHD